MSGDSGLNGDGGGLTVADLADHDDVGVLAQDGAQGVGEGQVSFGVDLNLIDALDIGFHGVLNGDDVDHVAVELVESGVQGGGFTGTGGAGDQHDAVGVAQDAVKGLDLLRGQTQSLLSAGQSLLLVESEHTLLTVYGGEGGDTNLIFPVVDHGGETAVLGLALFGDVQTADDLDAGHDCALQAQIVAGRGEQHTVNAEPYTNPVRLGLHVNIGGALAHGLLHEGGDQHDHGGGVDILLHDLLLHAAVDLAGLGVQVGGLLHLVGTVIAVDRQEDIAGGG